MTIKRLQGMARADLNTLHAELGSWDGVSRHIFEKRGVWFAPAFVCAVVKGTKAASVRLRRALGLIERRRGIQPRMSKKDYDLVLSVLPDGPLRKRILRAVDKINEQREQYPTRLVKHDRRRTRANQDGA